MSELHINDLPREILTEVFRFMDERTLKNATLTCKLWNNLIESTCRWSLELFYDDNGKLVLETQDSADSADQKMNFILTTNRKFETITISCGRFSEEMLKMFHKHGVNVVKLCLYEWLIDNLVAFAELLNLTPNLKHAIIIQRHIMHGEPDVPLDPVLPQLEKLKKLEMSVNDLRIIECFRKAKLTTIIIRESRHTEHYEPLVDFLSSQDILTSLTAEAQYSSRSILVEMGKLNVQIPFRLTQLEVSDVGGQKSSHDHDNLLRLVESQAKNLREMEIGPGFPSSVYDCVFANMPKLNTLSVSIDQIPRDSDFYERSKDNCNVHTIKLLYYGMDAFDDVQFFGNFLQKLPNVRSLVVQDSRVNKDALVMAEYLSNLESLSISLIGDNAIDCVKFSNLKTLHIQRLRVKINWNKFTKIHSRLAELTIGIMENESSPTSDDIDQITTNVHLQSIRLGAGFAADDRFFEIIQTKCTVLKVLDLHKSCISHGLSYNVKINVLRLFDDIECSK